ncbi:MAG: hypothetical protein EBS84_21345 [Proteobacteria bacterium]|nr:hypothetical protein [Verrucomicrobiota bacterium]NBU11516.1 hypothetical protein [Pseudomonadota bacterium]
MSNHTCPTCGHVTRSAKAKTVTLQERAALDLAYNARELTKDQYFAACKRIGFRDDLRFFVRVTGDQLPATLKAEATALLAELETRASKPADGRTINTLRDRYRVSKGSLIVRRQSATMAA